MTSYVYLFNSLISYFLIFYLIAPSEPRDLGATVSSSSEIIVHWSPPKAPNGIVSYYRITVTKILPYTETYSDRDFCSERNYLFRFFLSLQKSLYSY